MNIGKEAEYAQNVKLLREFCNGIVEKRQSVDNAVLRTYPDLLSRFISDARYT